MKRLQSFRYIEESPKRARPAKTTLQDLPPILSPQLKVVFIGFNPGVQSSIQQHHYAHPTNLFWKLFNESKLLLRVVGQKRDRFLDSVIHNDTTTVSAKNDTDLVAYGIGFTDLVLRCTKSAAELSLQEKLENVPRLLREFRDSQCEVLVFVGKGIWEVFVRYFAQKYGLRRVDFSWGVQEKCGDCSHERCRLLKRVESEIGGVIYVVPNTSGLVASMRYGEKLDLWRKLVEKIDERSESIFEQSDQLTSSEAKCQTN